MLQSTTTADHAQIELLPSFEEQLDADTEWAMTEGSLFFEQRGRVHESLRRITSRLDELGIAYAVVGGMALFHHGFRRFTEDVDILVTRDGLQAIHENLSGRGWLPPFERSKHLRDTQSKVKVKFIVAGQYPGDGKPKPVAFPDPVDVAVEIDGMRFISLPALVELKLASGMTSPDRPQDLVDVQRLVKELPLRREFGEHLNDYVRPKFEELWDAERGVRKRYMRIWSDTTSAANAASITDLVAQLRTTASELEQMAADGVRLEKNDDGFCLITEDREIAEKYGLHDEADFLD